MKDFNNDLGVMGGRLFYNTCKAYKSGLGHAITIPKRWGFRDGDLIDIHIDDSFGNSVDAYKRICRQSSKQNGLIVFMEKAWGLELSDFITVRVKLIGRSCPPHGVKQATAKLGMTDEEDPVQD